MGATLAGLRAVAVPLHGGRLRLDLIAHSDAQRAVVLWTNSPSNPTGGLDDLSLAAAWGRERDVLVVSDECYAEYTWSEPAHSILQSGLNGVLALHSISKRSNLAGVRAGFYAGDPTIVSYLKAVRQHAGLMVPAPVQAAVAEAYSDDQHVIHQRERYLGRLELLSAALSARGIDAPIPDGTFYLWISRTGVDGWALARELAEVAGLLASPGEFYGPDGSSHVRIAVVQPNEKLELAAHRLVEG
jgi:aspartate/methionine/tyrosine aminotransferase